LTEDGWNILGELILISGLQRYSSIEEDTDMAIGVKLKIIWTITDTTSAQLRFKRISQNIT
jgi:hypothetical protein